MDSPHSYRDPLSSFIAGGWLDGGLFFPKLKPEDQQAGIGAVFAVSFKTEAAVHAGTWYIGSLPENSTALHAGLMVGDTILKVFWQLSVHCMKIKSWRPLMDSINRWTPSTMYEMIDCWTD